MKRTLTGIAAAAVVLGAVAPIAFAATTPSYTNAGQVNFKFNGTSVSSPYILDSQDSGNTTAFAPVYYFNQLLGKAGITATWDGATHTWALTDSSVDASKVAVAGGVGTGNTTITLNGTVIKMINTFAAQDPAGNKGDITTYFPAYYVNNIFAAVGINASWNGTTGLAVTTAPASVQLSTPAVKGAHLVGTGTEASPAVSLDGSATTISTVLTDANGNPIPNATLSLQFTGNAAQPTVQQGTMFETVSNGGTDTWNSSVTTDSTGTATFSVGGLNSYTLGITAPYSNSGTAVSQNVYLGYVNGSALMTPNAGYSATDSSSASATAGLVPVTLTLPESNGAPQASQEVFFTVSGDTANTPFFSTSNGSNVGTTATAYTDANGQATVWVNDYNPETATVTAYTGSSAVPGNKVGTTTISYSLPNAPAAATLSSVAVSQFAPSTNYTPTTTSISGVSPSASLYVTPLDSSGAILGAQDEAYTLTATGGAEFNTFNGSALPTAIGEASTIQVSETDNSGTLTWYVDGIQVGTSTNMGFYVGLDSTTVPAAGTTVNVQSGSAKATAGFTAGASGTVHSTSFSPNSIGFTSNGGTQNVTFQVLDANGNPVPNTNETLYYSPSTFANADLWVTEINGVALAQTEGSAGTQATPIPLANKVVGSTNTLGYASGYSIPNVTTWGGTNNNFFTATTDKNGDITLTLQYGYVGYYSSNGAANTGAPSVSASGSTTANTYGGSSTTAPEVVYLGGQDTNWGTSVTPVGQINW